jgi:hypothetical protein
MDSTRNPASVSEGPGDDDGDDVGDGAGDAFPVGDAVPAGGELDDDPAGPEADPAVQAARVRTPATTAPAAALAAPRPRV